MAKSLVWPTITVVTPTFNSARTLERCLSLVRSQDYPQQRISIVLGDGGSSDATAEIAKKYRAQLIPVPRQLQNAEYNRGVAYSHARGELVLILDHDNYLPYPKYLQDLTRPLLDNPLMVATESCYYHYSPEADVIDRYCALFGTNEPLPYYLGKADRLPWAERRWKLLGQAQDKGDYFLVNFDPDPRRIPSVGTNGCLLRRRLVNSNADVQPDHHYPIDVLVDVIMAGHTQFGFVKNALIHSQQARGLINYLQRRWRFVDQYHFQDLSKRRWSVVLPGDGLRVAGFVILSLTLVVPVWDAFRGYWRIRDRAWWLHPVMCLATTGMYGYITLKNWLGGIK